MTVLPETKQEVKRSLEDYGKEAVDKTPKCKWCGKKLSPVVQHYPHEGGWPVEGMEGLQWLFIRCTGCDYDHSLWKLGVAR